MAKQIIHGIGKAILRDYVDPKVIIGFTDLQDATFESSYTTDDITGGNRLFPIASFKQEETCTFSATNATFDHRMLAYLNGAEATTGAQLMCDILEVTIPASKSITLDNAPVGDPIIEGFTKGDSTATQGQFVVSESNLTFADEDVGKVVTIFYEYNSGATAVEYAVKQTSLTKPFSLDYKFPIYNEDTQIVAYGLIKIFKAQCSSGFSINPQHQTAFAPQFECSAKDAQRQDGKLWTFVFDDITLLP